MSNIVTINRTAGLEVLENHINNVAFANVEVIIFFEPDITFETVRSNIISVTVNVRFNTCDISCCCL